MRRLVLFTRGAVPLTGLLLAISCGQEQVDHLRVADLLPVLEIQRGTGTILPSAGPVAPELLSGWVRGAADSSETRTAVRVREKRAHLRIVAAAPGDLLLFLEARALAEPENGPQTMSVSLAGEVVDTFELRDEYSAYSTQLPADLLRAGTNLLTLEFAAVGPIDAGDTTALGAARVRNLALRNSLGGPAPPWGPGDIVGAASGPEGDMAGSRGPASPDVVMPTDSLLDLALEVPEGARISAELVRSSSDDPARAGDVSQDQQGASAGSALGSGAVDPGDVHASLEVIDSEGNVKIVYEHEFREGWIFGSANRDSIDLSLDEWVGEKVLLRLRVWRGARGRVTWQDLRITCRCEARPPPYTECRLPQIPSSGRLGRPDIFIILLDAARADAFSAFGAARPTPSVDSLAVGGTKFTRASSTSSWTAPTTASLLTGRYPDAHGVEDWDRRVPDSITTLTEILSDAGYYTFLGSHHNVYRGNRPLRRGFEGIELIDRNLRSTLPGPDQMLVSDRPTFALIHLLPPHGPYEPPSPYRGMYTGNSEAVIDVSAESLNTYSRTPREPSEEAIRYVRDRYDENVAYADAIVGKLLEDLRTHDRLDDALVILLADHGEAFYEHGGFLHRQTLYEEVLRIPLVIKWPAGTDGYLRVVQEPVSLVDIGPTLLDGLGISDERASFQGISLLPAIFDGVTPDRSAYATTRASSSSRRRAMAIYRGQKKMILDEAGTALLYDLLLDPGEQSARGRDEPVILQFLLQDLLAQGRCNQILLAGAGQAPQIELDEERLRELRALGYIQ